MAIMTREAPKSILGRDEPITLLIFFFFLTDQWSVKGALSHEYS